MLRTFLGVALAIASLCTGSLAGADEHLPEVSIQWESSEGCLDSTVLLASVAQMGTKNALVSEAGDARIAGRAHALSDGHWSVLLTVFDRKGETLGERNFEIKEPGCDALLGNVTLVTAMLVDSAAVQAAARSEPSPAPHITPRHDAQNPLQATHDARPPRAHRMGLQLGPVAESGRLPGINLGGELRIRMALPGGVRAQLGLFAYPRATVSSADGMSRLRWRGAAAGLCVPAWRAQGYRLDGCAGLRLGEMFAAGAGFLENRKQHELLIDALIGVSLRRDLGSRLYLLAGLDAYAALRRPRFGYIAADGQFVTLHAPRATAVAGQIGLGFRFL